MTIDLARFRSLLAAVPLAVALAACGGADAGSADSQATPEDVDQEASATVTEEELAAFSAPADSVLTPEQVDRYLRTSLLQFDLVRKESVALHEKAKQMEERTKDGEPGLMAGLRNLADAGSLVMGWTDLVGGSYVRSARTQGYNPAEMEWVRERMVEVSAYMAMKPMMEQAAQGGNAMKQQVAEMRRQFDAGQLPGYTKEQLDTMAAQAEQTAAAMAGAGQEGTSRAVLANVEVLRKARPAVNDTMWAMTGWVGAASGLGALSGLADPNDQQAQKTLDEVRAFYQAVLENRAAPVPGSVKQ